MSSRLEMMQRAHKAERELAEWKAKYVELAIRCADSENRLRLCRATLERVVSITEPFMGKNDA